MDSLARAKPRWHALGRWAALVAACVAAGGCLGPQAVSHTRIRYNEVLRSTNDQQLLLNIVRLRYADSPVFIDLPNITSQFEASGQGSYNGGYGNQFQGRTSLGFGQLALRDTPTLSYHPREGKEIARALLTPLSAELLQVIRAGSTIEQFFLMAVNEGTFSKRASTRGRLWTIPVGMCAIVGVLPRLAATERVPMSTIPQRIASAFAVLCGRYGDVSQLAREREQSRQALDREAEQVVDAVDGAAAQVRIDDLQRQLAEQHAQVQALQERLKHAVEITPDKQDEFATVAQAEGVSLSVARRLWHVVAGSNSTPSVPTLGRVTLEAGERAGQLLPVLDEKARPKVEQAAADEIFWAANRS